MKNNLMLILTVLMLLVALPGKGQRVVRLAVAGMTHGHISFILGRPDKGDFDLVGVYDSDKELAINLSKRYDFSPELIYTQLEKMLDAVKPEVVVAFGSIYDHLAVVKACAPRGIDVMVEKPLAVNMKHATEMAALAAKYDIHLLTDYETSWYPSTAKAFQMVNDENSIGILRKVVFHHGHQGPKEIGCDKYFLGWLTDPVLNGGGAIVDFGCYGANLMTALTRGEKPVRVSAVTRQFKPAVYPEVDDNATIIVSYPDFECVIQASWNWPYSRKDMEIYGTEGFIMADNNHDMRVRTKNTGKTESLKVTAQDVPVYEDPFSYLYDVITGKISQPSFGLYSLENNMMVVQILDAARKSAKTGKAVKF